MKILIETGKHCDKFEELIGKKEINFHPATIEDLQACIKDWLLGDVGLKIRKDFPAPPSICIKILNIKGLKYIDIYPHDETFMFVGDEGHHDSIDPDCGSAYLLSNQFPEVKINITKDNDGSFVQIESKSGIVSIIDPRTQKDRSV